MARDATVSDVDAPSRNARLLEELLGADSGASSFFLARDSFEDHALTKDDLQASARLSALSGMMRKEPSAIRIRRAVALRLVYNNERYTEENHYGPYVDREKRADWPLIEALAEIMRSSFHLRYHLCLILTVCTANIENMALAWTLEWGGSINHFPSTYIDTLPSPPRLSLRTSTSTAFDNQQRDWAKVADAVFVGTYSFVDFRSYAQVRLLS